MDDGIDVVIDALRDAHERIATLRARTAGEALRAACARCDDPPLVYERAFEALIVAGGYRDAAEAVRALDRASDEVDAERWIRIAIWQLEEQQQCARARAILCTARALLSAPGAWCQGALARDAAGEPVGAHDGTACAWCLVGALDAAWHRCGGSGTPSADPAYQAAVTRVIAALMRRGYAPVPVVFNDAPDRRVEDVVAVLDAAMERVGGAHGLHG